VKKKSQNIHYAFFQGKTPNLREIILEEENKLLSDDITFDTSTKSVKEVRAIIKNLFFKESKEDTRL